jgi:hypothetical protein
MWRPGKGGNIGHNLLAKAAAWLSSRPATRGAPGARAPRNNPRKRIGVLTVPLHLRRCMRPRENDRDRFVDVDLFASR